MRLSIVFVASAWLVCANVAGCAQDAQRLPIPTSVATALVAQAPVIGKKSFGSGVVVSFIRPSFLFSEARVVDETLYVMYYPQQSQVQQIAVLSRGVLHPIVLAHEYWALRFENDNRVISAVGSGGVRDWYELRGARAIAIARPASQYYGIPHHVLADGDSCADGMAGSGSALDDILAHHRVSILTQAAMSHATNGSLTRMVGVYCDHFHGVNYATMDAPGVIFRVEGQRVSLVSTGWIEAASDRHLLMESDGMFVEAEVP
jgi:hypothetical protein